MPDGSWEWRRDRATWKGNWYCKLCEKWWAAEHMTSEKHVHRRDGVINEERAQQARANFAPPPGPQGRVQPREPAASPPPSPPPPEPSLGPQGPAGPLAGRPPPPPAYDPCACGPPPLQEDDPWGCRPPRPPEPSPGPQGPAGPSRACHPPPPPPRTQEPPPQQCNNQLPSENVGTGVEQMRVELRNNNQSLRQLTAHFEDLRSEISRGAPALKEAVVEELRDVLACAGAKSLELETRMDALKDDVKAVHALLEVLMSAMQDITSSVETWNAASRRMERATDKLQEAADAIRREASTGSSGEK